MNLFSNVTVECSEDVFETVPVPIVVLSSKSNVYPVTEMFAVFSSTSYLPAGRFSNVFEAPASTVKKYTVSANVCSSLCRYLPSPFFTENSNVPSTSSLLLSRAFFCTVKVPKCFSYLFSRVAVAAVVDFVTRADVSVVLVVRKS